MAERPDIYVDGTSSAFLGNEVAEASFTLSGVVKLSDTIAKFLTPSGSVITLDSDTSTGSVTFAGDSTAYAVTDGSNTEGAFSAIARRRLGKEEEKPRRMLGRRGAFLSTSGSFTLSSGGSNRAGLGRRRAAS